VQSLLAVIASPAHWSNASLPRGLKPEKVERLLNSITGALPSPKRGYAVVRLALDLGLRGIEISRLQLADIDWRVGTVTLKGTKSRRQDLMPLPVVTGRALEAYLRHERPKTSDTAVFARRLTPHDEPIGVDAIRRIVRDAFRRVGIQHGRGHALRHTVACRIVIQGARSRRRPRCFGTRLQGNPGARRPRSCHNWRLLILAGTERSQSTPTVAVSRPDAPVESHRPGAVTN